MVQVYGGVEHVVKIFDHSFSIVSPCIDTHLFSYLFFLLYFIIYTPVSHGSVAID
jgi:hypothetical protein